ncbi:AraC family transcriptional regulator [Gordonibacter sp. 28C]|uniref:helix-turn-helix domain-containing protein n=1 Tax=Gordonibacter sp. 28C TaxID=2078569 RepID=UPI0013145058|nr:AraC family transcriptional regulator [Gordonibacter sp. 28C]
MESTNLRAVERAIAHIEAHLGGKLDLDEVARAAGYSKFHLHRLFGEVTGMTVHAYVSRRRLTEAAFALARSERPIVDIAREAGYDNQQTFSAAFTALYKVPPARYRARGSFYPLQLPFSLRSSALRAGKGADVWTVERAALSDVAAWMELLRFAVDNFPCLDEDEHEAWLRRAIDRGCALVAREPGSASLAGAAAFTRERGSIDFLAVHPQHRRASGVACTLVEAVRDEVPGRDLTIATYRAGDRADTGHRRRLEEIGFEAADMAEEFGYPVQRFVLRAAARREEEREGGDVR